MCGFPILNVDKVRCEDCSIMDVVMMVAVKVKMVKMMAVMVEL